MRLRLAPLPPRRPAVKLPEPPVPLWDGREPLALEPLACQRAWQFRKLREPYRTEAVEALLRRLPAKWPYVSESDWPRIKIELREKAACPSPASSISEAADEHVDTPVSSGNGNGIKKQGYGNKSLAVRDAMTAHAAELLNRPNRKSRADFLAEKVGCSSSLAEKILKTEGR